jgi:hypothetical protein
MPCDDLVAPACDGAPETMHLDGHLGVGEVTPDVIDPVGGQLGIAVIVCLADDRL